MKHLKYMVRNMKKKDIFRSDVLNIFCDASTRKHGKNTDICYGAIAICKYDVLDEIYRINSNCTNNNAEIKAIRAGVLLGIRYKNQFSEINLFSDSQISLFGIRDRIFTWTYNHNDGLIYGYEDSIKSQDVFIDILNIIVSHNIKINFYHQKGHVKIDKFKSVLEAGHVFTASNNIRSKLDLNLIRYISNFNNMVDTKSRSVLMSHDITKLNIVEPIKFYPLNFYNQVNQYNNIIRR